MSRDELEQLIHIHGKAIYGFCFHLTGCREEADDLYQDTLLKAFEICKRIRHLEASEELSRERNYCMGIAVRLYKNDFRKKKRRRHESLDDENNSYKESLSDTNTPEALAEQRQLKDKVRMAIESLPLKQKTAIYLFYYSELSVSEISKALRIPEGTVKSRLNTAKKKLKKELGGDMYGKA